MKLQQLDSKWKLESRIEEIQLKIGKLPNLDNLQLASVSRKAILEKYLNKKFTKNQHEVKPVNVKILEQEAEQAAKKVDEAEKNKQKLENELAGLKEQLVNLVFLVTKKEVIELQSKRAAIEKIVDKLRTTIQIEEKKRDEIEPEAGKQLTLLSSKRDALLADIATGDSVDKAALQLIEEQIIEAEQKHSTLVDSAIEICRTINGLQAKLVKHENELSRVVKQHLEVFAVFIEQELESAGEEYVSQAKDLSAIFMKIASIGTILKECGLPSGAFCGHSWEFVIPKINHAACRPKEGSAYLFKYQHADKKQALLSTKKALVEMGVDIP